MAVLADLVEPTRRPCTCELLIVCVHRASDIDLLEAMVTAWLAPSVRYRRYPTTCVCPS